MRCIFLSLRRNILPLFFVLLAVCFVVFSRSNLTAATNGLTLWATCVVPSLFPFFVISNLLSQTKVVSFVGKLLDKLMRPLFNVPGIGGFAFVMGLISGYPVGAKVVSDFREQGLVTKDEGERMLAFTNNSGPLFIISSVGISLFGDTTTGLLLLCTHILACVTVGILLGKFSKKSDEEFRRRNLLKGTNYKYKDSNFKVGYTKTYSINKKEDTYSNRKYNTINSHTLNSKIIKNNNTTANARTNKQKATLNFHNVTLKNLGEVLGNSINSSISTILMIGGFVVIFSVIISILNQTGALTAISKLFYPVFALLGFEYNFAEPLVSGIIELTNGVNLVSGIHTKMISQNIVLCAFLLGFGGFSVLLQVWSIIAKTDLSIKKYAIGKFLQGICAACYTFLALKFIPFINLDVVQTSSTIPQNGIELLSNSNATESGINFISASTTTEFLQSFFYDFGVFVLLLFAVFTIFYIFRKVYDKVLS